MGTLHYLFRDLARILNNAEVSLFIFFYLRHIFAHSLLSFKHKHTECRTDGTFTKLPKVTNYRQRSLAAPLHPIKLQKREKLTMSLRLKYAQVNISGVTEKKP